MDIKNRIQIADLEGRLKGATAAEANNRLVVKKLKSQLNSTSSKLQEVIITQQPGPIPQTPYNIHIPIYI